MSEVPVDDTTLVSETSACLPACLVTYPSAYLSIRVTVAHIDVRLKLLAVCFHDIDYICYKHRGLRTEKEHVHILVTDLSLNNTIRKRLQKAGFSGNGSYSLSVHHNGLLAGIRYAAKEGTQPVVSGDFGNAIADAPKWEPRNSTLESHGFKKDTDPKKLRDWQLTYSNLVPQAVEYARANNLVEYSLKHVVREMMEKTKWKPCHQMYKMGVSPVYEEDFKVRLGKEKTYEMKWWENYTKYQ